MLKPQLLYTELPGTDEIGCLASLVPTVVKAKSSANPQDVVIKYDEEPISEQVLRGAEFCFIFLVDRSATMKGEMIELTKTALKIFIQNLPTGSCFQIISYGTGRTEMFKNVNQVRLNSEANVKDALEYIDSFTCDLGSHNGKDLLKPVGMAQDLHSG